MTTKAELEEEVQDNWEAFLDMQTRYHELRGAMVRIKGVVDGEYFGLEYREAVKDIIEGLDI